MRKPDSENKTEKAGNRQSAFLRFCGIFFLLLFFLTAAVLIIPGLFGIKTYYVVSGSMEPQIPVGSMIYVRECEPSKLKEGDIITFSSGNSDRKSVV